MGDVRYEAQYRRVAEAENPLSVIRRLGDEEVVAALAVANREREPYLANILATEAQNRMRRATVAMAHLGEGVVTTDTRGRVTSANPAARALLGYDWEVLRGEDFHELVHCREDGSPMPRAACAILHALEDFRERHQRDHGDAFRRSDGSVFAVAFTAAPITREGEVVGAVTVFRDITEEREAEERERRLAAIVESTDDAILGGRPDGTVTSWNRGAERMFGYAREEVMGRPVTFLLPPEREHEIRWLHEAIEGRGAIHYETERMHKDGCRIPVEVTLSPLIDPGEAAVGFAAIVRDITERKRADEKLRESEARYRALYEDTPVIAFTVDSEGTIQSANRYGANYLGYDVEELVGKPLVSVFHPEDREKIRAQLDLFFENPEGTVAHWEARKVHKNGTVLWVREVVRGMPAPSGGTHALVSCLDVSDVKRAEEELLQSKNQLERRVTERTREIQLANQELEAFSYSVSHDLRAPLRGIDTFAAILEEEYGGRLDDEGRELVARLRRESERATDLVRDLLALSRATRAEIRRETVDLTAFAGEIASDLRASDPDRPLELIIGGGVTAEGDPQLLRQLLTNLLDNAWKYTRREPMARIEFGAHRQDGEEVFFVRDNGVGFDPDDTQGLFQAFKRLHSPADFEGTGIGLAIVHRIAQRHGGRSWAESRPGAGATFYFTIPPAHALRS